MVEENISQEFKLKNIDEKRNCFVEEIKQNKLMSKKHKMVCTTLNYMEHFRFCCYWMYLNFYLCFFAWYSYKNYDFGNRIKNLCNNCKNYKV